MDANLHVNQALNHLNRVLSYYPLVREGDEATVWLTYEDWHVLADLLFRMGDPTPYLPEAVRSFRLSEDESAIVVRTADCAIRIETAG